MENKQLTKHFWLYEFLRTEQKQFREENYNITESQFIKLKVLANLEEIVRDIIGMPLLNSSGYRCEALNNFIHSVSTSQHKLCEAVDFIPIKIPTKEAFALLIKDIFSDIPRLKYWGQLIYETGNRFLKQPDWIHLSVTGNRSLDRCNQILFMKDGTYLKLGNNYQEILDNFNKIR